MFANGVDVGAFQHEIVEHFSKDASPGAVLALIKFLEAVNDENRAEMSRWSVMKRTVGTYQQDAENFAVELAEMRAVTVSAGMGTTDVETFGRDVVGPLIFGYFPDGSKRVSVAASVLSLVNQIGVINDDINYHVAVLISELTLGIVPSPEDDPRRIPWWALVAIGAGSALVLGGAVWLGSRGRQRR